MPRLPRDGIDYFPIVTDIEQDDKFALLEAELGELAFGRIIKLWAWIYRDGYYKNWTEAEELLFAAKKHIPVEDLRKLVTTALKWGIFDQDIHKKHAVLTSKGIQKRWIMACEKRTSIKMDARYVLMDLDEVPAKVRERLKIVSGENTGQSGEETPDNGPETLQDKGLCCTEPPKKEAPVHKAKQSKEKQQQKGRDDIRGENDGSIPGYESRPLVAAAAADFGEQVRQSLNAVDFAFPEDRLVEISTKMQAEHVDLGFIAFAAGLARRRAKDNPSGLLLSALTTFADWYEIYRKQRKRLTRSETGRMPRRCPTCGVFLGPDFSGEDQRWYACKKCGASGEWNVDSETWDQKTEQPSQPAEANTS